MEHTCNRALLDFIGASPTAWHAAENIARQLTEKGYRELYEQERWNLEPGGRYFVRRNGSTLAAFCIPHKEPVGFMLFAAHTDSPSFHVKGLEPVTSVGLYAQLGVEKYGGMLMAPWLDRPLSVAGRVVVREGERIKTRLVNIDRDLLVIPNVAIHMDRKVNEEKRWDTKIDMLPLLGSAGTAKDFHRLVAEAAGVSRENLLTADLRLYPRTPGCVWGAEEEYISSPRLDDLQCVFGGLQGFLSAGESESVPVFCAFDNEEVGSTSRQGAGSTFLFDTLSRICAALGLDASEYRRLLAQSMMVSADNAHAVHPNHPEYADKTDRPVLNGGIVVKFNAGMKYTTDALSSAVFEEICRRVGVPVQRYSNRPDLAGGWTLGHISLEQVSVPSVDVGLAQLAMHSCYETAGARDTDYLIRAAARYFSGSLRLDGEGLRIL